MSDISHLTNRFLNGYDVAISLMGENKHEYLFGKEGQLYYILLELANKMASNSEMKLYLHVSVLLFDHIEIIDYVELCVHRNKILSYLNDFRINRYSDKSSVYVCPQKMLNFFTELSNDLTDCNYNILINLELTNVDIPNKNIQVSNFNVSLLQDTTSVTYDIRNNPIFIDLLRQIPNHIFIKLPYLHTFRVNKFNEENEILIHHDILDSFKSYLSNQNQLKLKLSNFNFSIDSKEFLHNYFKYEIFSERVRTNPTDILMSKIKTLEDILERERRISGIFKKPDKNTLNKIKRFDEVNRRIRFYLNNKFLNRLITFNNSTFHGSWFLLFSKYSQHIRNIENNYKHKTIIPRREEWFKSFEIPVEDINVVLIGNEPLLSKHHITPSLRNIFLQLQSEFPERNYKFTHGDISRWKEEKIFLLTKSLTLIDNNMMTEDWSLFIEDVFNFIKQHNKKCVFLSIVESKFNEKMFTNVEKSIGYALNWNQ